MAKPNFNLSGVLGETKSNATHAKKLEEQVAEAVVFVNSIKEKPKKTKEVKKCLLSIPVDTHKPLKKYCTDNDIKITEFIIQAIQEKLQK